MSTFDTRMGADFVLDDVNCTGNESNIFDCPHPKSTRCEIGREEAGAMCGVSSGT